MIQAWQTTNPLLLMISKDQWAVKAIEYLVRKDYSSEEIFELMVEIGIRRSEHVES